MQEPTKERISGRTAREIAHRIMPVGPDAPCADVFARFMGETETLHIPVLRDGHPVGIVNRQDFTLVYTVMYGKEIYGRKPISVLMDRSPIVVASSLTCETLNQLLVSQGRGSMLKGFLVLHDRKYYGVGSVMDVLAAIADLMSARARELEHARVRAEQASISKTNFLASMSHELRTPLNAIIGFADLVRKETFGALEPAPYREYVDDIYGAGSHLLGMINEILDMAKIESGRFVMHEHEFDPSETAEGVFRMLRHALVEGGLTFSINHLGKNAPLVRGDEQQFQQVLLNLLSNAIKFTPSGGSVEFRSCQNDDGTLSIQVRDTGIGIPPEKLEKVFEPFEQVENSLTRSQPGTGLGLPLARAMIEAHGGTLVLKSTVGEGTCACVTLPAERVITGQRDTSRETAA